MSKKLQAKYRITIEEAAAEFSIDFRSLKAALSRAEIAAGDDGRYSLLQCHRAIAGDLEAEKIRLTRHQANLAEMEEQEKRGTLGSVAEMKSWLERKASPIKAIVLASSLEPQEKEELLKAFQEVFLAKE